MYIYMHVYSFVGLTDQCLVYFYVEITFVFVVVISVLLAPDSRHPKTSLRLHIYYLCACIQGPRSISIKLAICIHISQYSILDSQSCGLSISRIRTHIIYIKYNAHVFILSPV